MSELITINDLVVSFETEEELKNGASQVVSGLRPDWKMSDHEYKIFNDGITNRLVGVFQTGDKSDMILVRVYGNKSELFVDRQAEIRNIRLMSQKGFGGKLYATFSNGLAYQFVQGDILNVETCRNPEVYPEVARTVARMHRDASEGSKKAEACIWKKIQTFLDLSPDEFPDNPEKNSRYKERVFSKAQREAEIKELKSVLENLGSPIVFCHNDLLLANIVVQPGNKIQFIDYEYGDFNYQAFDIADHFCEFAGIDSQQMDYANLYPDKEFQTKWLRIYLETLYEDREVTSEEVDSLYRTVNKFALLVRLFWGTWALVQANISGIDFDFLGYAILILDEYKRRKNEFLAL
jgi:ethanolamine kinase